MSNLLKYKMNTYPTTGFANFQNMESPLRVLYADYCLPVLDILTNVTSWWPMLKTSHTYTFNSSTYASCFTFSTNTPFNTLVSIYQSNSAGHNPECMPHMVMFTAENKIYVAYITNVANSGITIGVPRTMDAWLEGRAAAMKSTFKTVLCPIYSSQQYFYYKYQGSGTMLPYTQAPAFRVNWFQTRFDTTAGPMGDNPSRALLWRPNTAAAINSGYWRIKGWQPYSSPQAFDCEALIVGSTTISLCLNYAVVNQRVLTGTNPDVISYNGLTYRSEPIFNSNRVQKVGFVTNRDPMTIIYRGNYVPEYSLLKINPTDPRGIDSVYYDFGADGRIIPSVIENEVATTGSYQNTTLLRGTTHTILVVVADGTIEYKVYNLTYDADGNCTVTYVEDEDGASFYQIRYGTYKGMTTGYGGYPGFYTEKQLLKYDAE